MKDYPETMRILNVFFRTFLPSSIIQDVVINQADIERVTERAGSEILKKIQDEKTPSLYIAKLFYLFGLEVLPTSPVITEKFWEGAVRSYPNLGVLSAELASLEFYTLEMQDEARAVINRCNHNPESALHCSQIDSDFSNLTFPGDLQSAVLHHQ